jgi:hypothetical protein
LKESFGQFLKKVNTIANNFIFIFDVGCRLLKLNVLIEVCTNEIAGEGSLSMTIKNTVEM